MSPLPHKTTKNLSLRLCDPEQCTLPLLLIPVKKGRSQIVHVLHSPASYNHIEQQDQQPFHTLRRPGNWPALPPKMNRRFCTRGFLCILDICFLYSTCGFLECQAGIVILFHVNGSAVYESQLLKSESLFKNAHSAIGKMAPERSCFRFFTPLPSRLRP